MPSPPLALHTLHFPVRSLSTFHLFLPLGAMHNRGLYRNAVSVTFVHCAETVRYDDSCYGIGLQIKDCTQTFEFQ